MFSKIFILFSSLILVTCVAQPFTPFIPTGKTKKQSLPLILPPTTRTSGCALDISATNISSASGVRPVVVTIGLTGTKTTSQFTAITTGTTTNVTSSTTWANSDPTVASITASVNAAGTAIALVTALKVGSTIIEPSCDPGTTITVTVVATQNNILEEKSTNETQILNEENKESTKHED